MQYSSDFTVMMRKPVIYILLTGEDEEWTEIMKNQKVFRLVWIDKRERYIAQRVFDNFDWEHFYAHITRYNKLDMLEDHFPCETGSLFCKKFNKRCTKEKN